MSLIQSTVDVPEPSTVELLKTPLFKHRYEEATRLEHVERSYCRARAIGRHYRITLEDIHYLTPKFWNVHTDPIITRDGTAQILLTIQYNLVAGTLAPFVLERPDLRNLMDEVLNFDISCPFMLNEIDHGCDARNLETTATLQSDGSFILHTPQPGAAKFMPPSMPMAGIRRVAIVFARLLVEGDNRGLRPFVVPLNDGMEMCRGVTSRLLPEISGGRMLDHAVTTFDHVALPSTAMLGDFTKPEDFRQDFLSAINRLSVGALCLTLWTIPFLKLAAFIVGKYSQRRTVQQGLHGERTPIISFRTQQLPILHAIAQAAVMEPFAEWIEELYRDSSIHPEAKHGLGVVVKVVFLHDTRASLNDLIERSGAQGVYPHNQMVSLEALTRITGIAEGEVLVLSLRLATELLLRRYKFPEAKRSSGLLERHECGFFEELAAFLKANSAHRGEAYNHHVLPQCRSLVLAIGQRMAYEAAADAGVNPDLLALYEAGAVKSDSAWYVEKLQLSRAAQIEMESKAASKVLLRLNEHLDNFQIEPYVTAPIVSPSNWNYMLNAMPTFEGTTEYDILKQPQSKL